MQQCHLHLLLLNSRSQFWETACPVNRFNNGGGANCGNCAAGTDTQGQTGATSCTRTFSLSNHPMCSECTVP